jgi:TP901 family phage tail tape measure protein
VANLDIIIRAQNLASAALRQVEGQLSGIQRQASFAERGFGGLQRAVGVGMVAAAGLAVVGVGALAVGLAKSVTAAADFESQINILTVAARSSGTTMEDLSKAALQVGADSQLVGISASEAADAMTNFYKAGLTTNEIFADMQGYLAGTVPLTGALRSAIDLAAASELDLAAASDVVAIAMATFGLEAADAARIADVLVGAADASLASVGGLAEALKNVGPIAATMGISLEDTSTALAILSTRGIQGAEAGTAMRSMLLNLQRPTKAVTTALDELGVSLYSTDGTMRALPDVIGQLEGALSGLTEEQRNQYAVTLAGSYGLNAFNVLVGEGTGGWNEMSTAVANAATAQETAAARTKGFNAAIEQLKGALETLLITVGTPLIQEFLTPAAQKMGDVITQLTKMAPSVEQVRAAYDKLHLRLLIMKERLAAFIGPIAEAIGRFVSWKDVLIALGIVVASIVIPFLWGIVAAVAPVLVVFAALVGAVALIRTAWEKDWGGIQEKTQSVIDWLQPAMERMRGWLDLIKAGDWSGLVNAVFADVGALLSSASAAIAAFDWADWIDGALDWAVYIGKLAWDSFLTLLDWQVYIWKLEWSMFVTALDWAAGWITSLPWADYVTALGEWSAYVGELAWDGFVSALTWGAEYISKLPWGDYVTALSEWSAYVGTLAWDSYVSALTWGAEYVASLDWASFVSTLSDWGAWISSLDWASFVSTLSDWGTWISSLDWTKIITTVIDWATWIPALTWNSFVMMLDWITIVAAFDWTEWISKLTWADFVAALSWVGKIAEFGWDSFVSKLEWPLIAQFDWSGWINSFDWPRLPSFRWSSFINSFGWPRLPSFSWSSFINSFGWPSLPSFSWSDWIPSFSWPHIPEFTWPTFSNPFSNAAGSGFFAGGLTLVGERGPELAYLPRGTRIESSERTSQMMGNGGMTVNVYATVSNQMDVEELAYRVAQTIQRRQR